MIEPKTYTKKPDEIQVVEVTLANLDEVVKWIGLSSKYTIQQIDGAAYSTVILNEGTSIEMTFELDHGDDAFPIYIVQHPGSTRYEVMSKKVLERYYKELPVE